MFICKQDYLYAYERKSIIHQEKKNGSKCSIFFWEVNFLNTGNWGLNVSFTRAPYEYHTLELQKRVEGFSKCR